MSHFHLLAGAVCLGWLGAMNAARAQGSAPVFSTSDPLSLQHGIEQAYKAGLPRVVIPPGIYQVGAEPKSGAHLHFAEMKNFEIDATGVTLVFTDRTKGGINFHHCEGVTFRGATLRRGVIPFSQGHVIALSPDRKTIDVRVSPGYPTEFDDPHLYAKMWLNRYDPATRRWQEDMWLKGQTVQRLDATTFRCQPTLPLGAAWKPGTAVAWRGGGGTDIELDGCAKMKIVDVVIKGGSGFCVFESGGDGGNYYRYTVTYCAPPPGATERPLMASNADAFHSNGVRHGPTLEDCLFEGMDDDGVPIHGKYSLVREAQGSQVVIETGSPPYCRAGDRLRFLDLNEALGGEAKVVSVEMLPGYQPTAPAPKDLRDFQGTPKTKFERITLDQPVAAQFGWLVNNADANGDGFVVRRCTVRNSRARGMLIKACDGLIEDCTVENVSMGGIIVTPEPDYWDESDYARHVVIRHNTVRNSGYWSQQGSSQAGAITVAGDCRHHFVPLPGGHRDIVIEDNSIEDVNGPNLVVTSTEGIVIKDNRFVRPMQQLNARGSSLGITPGSLIWLTESNGVQVLGNTVSQPGPFLVRKIEATRTVTGIGLQDGVTAAP
jgi:hypothetical protein